MNMIKLYWARLLGKRLRNVRDAFRLFHLETTVHDITECAEALDIYVFRRAQETRKWRRLAWRYGLDIPDANDKTSWDKLHYSHLDHNGPVIELVFTKSQIAKYRSAIRSERTERANFIVKWATLLASIVAALSGVTVLLKQ